MHPPHSTPAWRRQFDNPEVRLSLITSACLIVEAVIAKNVIDVELDVFSQFVPLWVFIVYLVSGLRDRASELWFAAAIAAVTAAVLILYAI